MALSPDAARYLQGIIEVYAKDPPSNYRLWNFDTGKEDTTHQELNAAGLIERVGTRGAPWRLTELGNDLISIRAEAFRDDLPEGTMHSVEDKQRHRFQLLKALYEKTGGNPKRAVLGDDLQLATSLSSEAFEMAEAYLEGEGLIEGITVSHISLTHAGVVEYERVLSSAQGRGVESEYFPTAVIQPVLHFHAPVASVQTGSGTIGTVQQTVTYSQAIPAELREQLSALIAAMRSQAENEVADAVERTEALAALHNIEQQLAKPKPASERINSYLGIFASLVTVASANVQQLQQLLPHALAAFGAH